MQLSEKGKVMEDELLNVCENHKTHSVKPVSGEAAVCDYRRSNSWNSLLCSLFWVQLYNCTMTDEESQPSLVEKMSASSPSEVCVAVF